MKENTEKVQVSEETLQEIRKIVKEHQEQTLKSLSKFYEQKEK